jgi:uncharacterized protein YkwD
MLRRGHLALAAAVLTLSAATLPASAAHPVRSQKAQDASLASELLTDLNSVRRQHGLTALEASPALRAAAAQHSREMAVDGYFSHNSMDGSPFWKRLARYYPSTRSRLWAAGENLLWSSPSIGANAAIRLWLGSPEHRRNMLDARWREVGIATVHMVAASGFYQGREITVVTADFGVRR